MKLNDYDDFIEYVLDEFEIEDDITVVCDYKLADILNYYFGDEEYHEYKGIDLQSDVNEYYVTKFDKDFFCITPIKYEGKIKTTTGNYFIIDNNILEENPTLFNHLEGDSFKVEVIDYEEDYYCNNCCNECETTEDAEIDEEYICYLELADLIEEYTGLILDNDCKVEVLGHALTEFAGRILEEVCLERIG
ncbi:hypothetical protein EJM73_09430 [Clostridium botulinum]|uniref:hypothetical protein n=1 Tax=Clostridium botulinum TaxID=1491 RepID=UPI001375D7BA|nr:hypothetical protein [Clostridium botulinum]NCI19847.1 hypothetical protein [Clostridium botulinum]NCI35885.1 hypothetical protein [Clostridium botulinum]NCI71742.1 hypothetical protein [Clostridium botulinum]NDI38658.1 hypothetical protein [Clostridium botulinum]